MLESNDLIVRLIVIIHCNMYDNSSARFLFSVQKKKKRLFALVDEVFLPPEEIQRQTQTIPNSFGII